MTDIGMIIGQFMRLFGNRICDLCATIADIHAIQARKGIQAALAIRISDVNTLAGFDNAVRRFAPRMGTHCGGRVKKVIPVPFFQRLVS